MELFCTLWCTKQMPWLPKNNNGVHFPNLVLLKQSFVLGIEISKSKVENILFLKGFYSQVGVKIILFEFGMPRTSNA